MLKKYIFIMLQFEFILSGKYINSEPLITLYIFYLNNK